MDELADAQIIVTTGVMDIPPVGVAIDMLVVVNADIGLSVPDYTAQWQTFSFLSRTLDAYASTPIAIVQSHDVEQEAILFWARGDRDAMRSYDLAYREKFLYPPYCELARILYKHEIEENVFDRVNKLYQEMLYLLETGPYEDSQIELIPTPPLVFKAFGKFRYNIIIKGKEIRNYLDDVVKSTWLLHKAFKVDREPGRIV